MKFVSIFCLILLISSCSSLEQGHKKLSLNEDQMVLAVESINKFTQQKNYEEAVKFYFSGTRFYQYQNLGANQTSTSQTYDEAIPSLKTMFKFKAMKLIESDKIFEEVKFNEQGLGSVLTYYNRTYLYQGTKIQAQEKYLRVFGHHDGKMVILEEHLL